MQICPDYISVPNNVLPQKQGYAHDDGSPGNANNKAKKKIVVGKCRETNVFFGFFWEFGKASK
jgi:hypothetical protein